MEYITPSEEPMCHFIPLNKLTPNIFQVEVGKGLPLGGDGSHDDDKRWVVSHLSLWS